MPSKSWHTAKQSSIFRLQRADQDHSLGRAWESVSRRVLARAGSSLVGRVAAGLSLGREGRERSRLAEHGHDGKALGSHFCYVLVLFCLDVRGVAGLHVHWLDCSTGTAPV